MKKISLKRLFTITCVGAAFPLGVLLADDRNSRDEESRELADRVREQLGEQLGSDEEFLEELLRRAADGGGGFKLEIDGEEAESFLEGDDDDLAARLLEMLRKADRLDRDELQLELEWDPKGEGTDDRRMGDFMGFFQKQLESRRPGRNEKDDRSALEEWEPVMRKAHGATAAVLNRRGDQVALATVVHPDGYLVTKASELPKGPITCEFTNGKKRAVKRLDVNRSWDLALIKVDATDLRTVRWASGDGVDLGTFLAASGTGDYPVAIGVASVAPRNLAETTQGYFGIAMEDDGSNVSVSAVLRGGAAEKAGMKIGDLILAVGDVEVESSAHLKSLIGGRRPGDEVGIKFRREGEIEDISVALGKSPKLLDTDGRNPGNQMGGRLSATRDEFPNALQHDLTLKPEECGGPLLDLDGRAVGVNVARSGRVKSFAIPAADLRALLGNVESGRFVLTDSREIERELEDADNEIERIEAQLERARKRRAAAEAALESSEN